MDRQGKTAKQYKPAARAGMIALVFIGTVCTAMLSFISMELALLGFGVFTIGCVLMIESRRRNFWELAATFKFKSLKDTQNAQEKDLLRHAFEIEGVKVEIKALRSEIKYAAHKVTEMKTQPQAPMAPPVPVNAPPEGLLEALKDTKWASRVAPPPDLRTSPRAVKASQILEEEDDFFAPQTQAREDSFDDLSDTLVRELLHYAVQSKRVEVFVQPIMRLPQRQTRFYEIFARIRAQPGQYLPASRYMPIAEQDNLQSDIDTMLLLQCLQTIQTSAHIEKAAPFFINVKSGTLKNTAFMKRLLGFLAQNRNLAPRLVFELPQAEFEALPTAILKIIHGLGQLGCSFSLDHIQHMNFDILDLQNHKIRFIKIAAQMLDKAASGAEFSALQREKRKLEANGIGVIVEKIETENQLRALLDFDIHYGQGYLFGKPELQGAYANRARVRRSENAAKSK
jgi:EAL domain-containing protein (putative c-di-GMP-specific phosphodiesterase class I)